MKEEQHRFLTLPGRLPARLTAEQTAWVLGCQPHDVPILMAARLLKPLGHPPPEQRQVLCHRGGAGKRPGTKLVDQGHECAQPVLAKEERRPAETAIAWTALGRS
jgi:hypothetical protein